MVETTHQLVPAPADSLHAKVLGGADRAKYGDQLIKRTGQQLVQEFGRGFEAKNLRRRVQFAVAFPDTEKVASLMRHLSWTHFLQLLPVKTDDARWFHARQSVDSGAVRPAVFSSHALLHFFKADD